MVERKENIRIKLAHFSVYLAIRCISYIATFTLSLPKLLDITNHFLKRS